MMRHRLLDWELAKFWANWARDEPHRREPSGRRYVSARRLQVTLEQQLGLPVEHANIAIYDSECYSLPEHIDSQHNHTAISLFLGTRPDFLVWPLFVEDTPFLVAPGEAILYSTRARHWRQPMPHIDDYVVAIALVKYPLDLVLGRLENCT